MFICVRYVVCMYMCTHIHDMYVCHVCRYIDMYVCMNVCTYMYILGTAVDLYCTVVHSVYTAATHAQMNMRKCMM